VVVATRLGSLYLSTTRRAPRSPPLRLGSLSLLLRLGIDPGDFGVVFGDPVDVTAKLGVARLQPGAVEAVALLDGLLDLLVVAETLVPAA
jgi:hypothetical protein